MPLEAEDLAAIAKLINDSTSGLAKVEDVSKMVDQSIGKLNLADQIQAAVKAVKPEGDKGGDKGKNADGSNKGENPEHDARMAALEQRVADADKARQEAEERSRIQARDAQLRDGLTGVGIPADRLAFVLPYLREQRLNDGTEAISFDENGQPVWKVDRNGFTDALPIAKAAEEWVSTDAAKQFLPPTGGAGLGGNAGGRGGFSAKNLPRTSSGSLDLTAIATNALSSVSKESIDAL